MTQYPGKGAPEAGVRERVMRQAVRADHGLGMRHDALDIAFVHGEINRACGLKRREKLGELQGLLFQQVVHIATSGFWLGFRPGDQCTGSLFDGILTQNGGRGDIGIAIHAHIAICQCIVDECQCFSRAAVVGAPIDFVMRDDLTHTECVGD